jgi:hypothetical protein
MSLTQPIPQKPAHVAVALDEEGTYPFVSHAFAHVDLGQVGILKVGNPKTTMGH